MLIRLERGPDGAARFREAADLWTALETGAEPDGGAAVLAPLERVLSEGERWLSSGLAIGARLAAEDRAEALQPLVGRLALVALDFPVFRDGRAYSSAAVLRGALGYRGELRAVGGVLREQASLMVRAGFDSFVPADGSDAAAWAHAAGRYAHVYQAAPDGRPPAWAERAAAAR